MAALVFWKLPEEYGCQEGLQGGPGSNSEAGVEPGSLHLGLHAGGGGVQGARQPALGARACAAGLMGLNREGTFSLPGHSPAPPGSHHLWA